MIINNVESTDTGLAIRKIALVCTEFHPTVIYAAMAGLMAVIKQQTPELVPSDGVLARVEDACMQVMAQISPESE
jgi:hypothetical protein